MTAPDSNTISVRLYFWAQLVNALAVYVGSHFFDASLYALLYVGATLPILECCCFMIYEERLALRWPIAFGLFVGMIASFDMTKHPLVDYVTFAEGVLLSIIGTALLLSVRAAVRSIGALSVALSCYDFGYLNNDDWTKLNPWLPAALCCVAFAWIVYRSRDASAHPTLEQS